MNEGMNTHIIYIYLHLPVYLNIHFRNYCWGHVFLLVSKFCIFLPLHVFAGVETPKKTSKQRQKIGNSDILGNWRQLLLFQISSDNFA